MTYPHIHYMYVHKTIKMTIQESFY